MDIAPNDQAEWKITGHPNKSGGSDRGRRDLPESDCPEHLLRVIAKRIRAVAGRAELRR
jgi:hypothetical protein